MALVLRTPPRHKKASQEGAFSGDLWVSMDKAVRVRVFQMELEGQVALGPLTMHISFTVLDGQAVPLKAT